jgi:Ca2+-binding EF-hand superfamily protein
MPQSSPATPKLFITSSMSRFGLSPRFLSATLFIAIGLRAQDAAKPATGMMGKAGNRAQETMKRYDKNGDGRIDDDERADAQEVMLKERLDRQAQLGVGAPEALRARLLEVFDKNRDGRLDEEERTAVAEYSPGVNPALRGEIMQRFDRNRDGKIDDAERSVMMSFLTESRPPAPAQTAAVRQELLARFDRNVDGKIELQEMAEAEKLLRPEISESAGRRERYDLDGDGRLDDAEWGLARGQIFAWLNGTMVAPVSPAEEQKRLEAVAKEVARRRALREEAMESNAPLASVSRITPSAPSASVTPGELEATTPEQRARLDRVAEEVKKRRLERERAQK